MKPVFKYRTFLLLAVIGLLNSSCKKEETGPANSVVIQQFDPNSPATLNFEEFVVITTAYDISNSDGARIWVQPYTEGEKSPGFLYSSSRVYYGSGIREVGISVEETEYETVLVDQLRIIVTTPDQDQDLFERFIDVSYTFTNK